MIPQDLEGAYPHSIKREAERIILLEQIVREISDAEQAKRLHEMAIQYHERGGNFREAAELAEEIGDIERAIRNYGKSNFERDLYKAALLAKYDKGDLKRAKKLFLKTIKEAKETIIFHERYHKLDELPFIHRVAILAEEEGDFETAAKFYVDTAFIYGTSMHPIQYDDYILHNIRSARERGHIDQTNEMFEWIIRVYEKEGRYNDAARIVEEKGEIRRARAYRTLANIEFSDIGIRDRVGFLKRFIKILDAVKSVVRRTTSIFNKD